MEETPFRSGLLRTSTPSTQDSGFGSDNRSFYHKLTPVKESPHQWPAKLKQFECELSPFHFTSPDRRTSRDVKLGHSVIKQLKFDDSGFVNESQDQDSGVEATPFSSSRRWFCPENTPSAPTRINKSFFSIPSRVDFLAFLRRKNCERIISDLLSYLPAEDLCRMNCVSKTWKELIMEDVKANGRRREYLKMVKAQRENRLRLQLPHFDLKKRYEQLSMLPQIILQDITNCYSDAKVVPTKNINARFDPFVKKKKCPTCLYAAEKQSGDIYFCSGCYFSFCGKCLSPFKNTHNCPMLKQPIPKLIIGSKQCKKNLRRL